MPTPAPRLSAPLGVGLVVTGALLFVANAGVSRVVLRHGVAAGELTALRVTGTLVVLVCFAALVRRPSLRPPSGRQLALVVALGLFGVAALQFAYFVAIDRLTIGLALLLEYQAPFLVALWAKYVQRTEVTARLWWGLSLAVVGLAAATEVWRGASFDAVGVTAGVASAGCFAAYFLIGEAGLAELAASRVMLWSFLVAAVVLNLAAPVWGLATGPAVGGRVSLLGRLAAVEAPLVLLLTSVVVLGTLLPFGLMLLALRYLPATAVTMIAMLEPIGAAALGWAWFRESMSAVAVVGCVAVVAGILLAQAARREHPVEEPPVLT